ncbi:MAG: EpsG family protein [Anaerostipes sp.]|jgi:transmembrane protein EpsG|nr:EpsG family protein [Anaerostipes sp.]
MKIYWMFLIISLITYAWSESRYRIVESGNHYENRAFSSQAIVFFAVIIFFCGLRSGIADTGTYIAMFKEYPSSIGAIDWASIQKGKGFYLISVVYKQFISRDFHGWLFLIALVSGFATMKAFQKYSSSFGFSCYLFIATTIFTYLVNGMRQYIVVSIFFWLGTEYILERKFSKYLLLILLLSTVHTSAWILLIVYFFRDIKPWSMQMWALLAGFVVAGVGFDQLFPYFGEVLGNTQYKGYVDYFATSAVGSSLLRLGIAAVPCIISYIAKEIIREQENELINLAITMSVINFGLYIVATFSSGMVIGRLTVYFDIFNLILLPWLFKYTFNEKSSKIITLACMGIYAVFFYFQMVMTWGIVYESDILHLYL